MLLLICVLMAGLGLFYVGQGVLLVLWAVLEIVRQLFDGTYSDEV